MHAKVRVNFGELREIALYWVAARIEAYRRELVAKGVSDASRGLVDVARTAIVELLRVLERRWDNRRRSASIAHDFRSLARPVGVVRKA